MKIPFAHIIFLRPSKEPFAHIKIEFANVMGGNMVMLVYAQFFSLSLEDEGGGVQLVYAGHLFAGMEGYF